MATISDLDLKQGDTINAVINGFSVQFQFEYQFHYPKDGMKFTFMSAKKIVPTRPTLKGDQI